MKKFFAVIFVTLLVVASLVGCSSTSSPNYISAKDGEWVEIHSVTYYTNNEANSTYESSKYTITSTYCVETTKPEEITQEEYLDASENKISSSINLSGGEFSVDRESTLQALQNSTNKTFNYIDYPNNYYKVTVKSYEIRYVKIRFLDNDTFELNYYYGINDISYTTIRVKPLSYTVTYFNN